LAVEETMKLIKPFTLKWWQVSIFKVSCIAFGLAVGLTWPELFVSLRALFWALAFVLGGYITFVWWKR
jgi:hypothetical protein